MSSMTRKRVYVEAATFSMEVETDSHDGVDKRLFEGNLRQDGRLEWVCECQADENGLCRHAVSALMKSAVGSLSHHSKHDSIAKRKRVHFDDHPVIIWPPSEQNLSSPNDSVNTPDSFVEDANSVKGASSPFFAMPLPVQRHKQNPTNTRTAADDCESQPLTYGPSIYESQGGQRERRSAHPMRPSLQTNPIRTKETQRCSPNKSPERIQDWKQGRNPTLYAGSDDFVPFSPFDTVETRAPPMFSEAAYVESQVSQEQNSPSSDCASYEELPTVNGRPCRRLDFDDDSESSLVTSYFDKLRRPVHNSRHVLSKEMGFRPQLRRSTPRDHVGSSEMSTTLGYENRRMY
eukprot:TRINITY_DN3262_c0_g1_i1.p1 TRINITY_DN3262_c0_g1~~TRINITY_DN3262_c0_g1_i1.p1  ORF type:complete len:347 (-),score=51.09 TRINITY_DN3262_c0_g1_i1:371-1411(-)